MVYKKIKTSNLEKIIIKFLKDNNLYSKFTKCIKHNQLQDAIMSGIDFSSPDLLYNIIVRIENRNVFNKYNNISDLKYTIAKINIANNFISLLNEHCIKYLMAFIHEYNLMTNLDNNIKASGKFENFIDCLYYFKNNNGNIFNILKFSFNWFSSEEGYSFWSDVHFKLYYYIIKKLCY